MVSFNGVFGDFVNQVGGQFGQFGQIIDVMDGVNCLNVGDINVLIDQYIIEDMMIFFIFFLGFILDFLIVINMFMFLLCMVFVSYVLFGK